MSFDKNNCCCSWDGRELIFVKIYEWILINIPFGSFVCWHETFSCHAHTACAIPHMICKLWLAGAMTLACGSETYPLYNTTSNCGREAHDHMMSGVLDDDEWSTWWWVDPWRMKYLMMRSGALDDEWSTCECLMKRGSQREVYDFVRICWIHD